MSAKHERLLQLGFLAAQLPLALALPAAGGWWNALAFYLVWEWLFYWLHRSLHHRALWPVHEVHHGYQYTSVTGAFQVHTLERLGVMGGQYMVALATGAGGPPLATILLCAGVWHVAAHASGALWGAGILITAREHSEHHFGAWGQWYGYTLALPDRLHGTAPAVHSVLKSQRTVATSNRLSRGRFRGWRGIRARVVRWWSNRNTHTGRAAE